MDENSVPVLSMSPSLIESSEECPHLQEKEITQIELPISERVMQSNDDELTSLSWLQDCNLLKGMFYIL